MTEEEYYLKIKAEYENSTDTELVEWARPYFEGTKEPNGKDVYIICPVSDRTADEIMRLTGSDVHRFRHAIADNEVRHINRRHGACGIADQSMSDINDLGRMAYVLNHFDSAELSKKRSQKFRDKTGQKAKVVVFTKRIDGHVYTSEAVTDIERKRLMCVNSMYKKFDNKKGSQEPDAHKSVPELDVRNEVDSITYILPQSERNVKH